ncbi:potassium channel family protein [Gleimia coleocanis]|nr:potassium channel family protein [Gleimia coleocanis]
MSRDDTESKFGLKLERWEAKTQTVMAVLAVLFLTLYAYEVLAQPNAVVVNRLETGIFVIWLVFLADYLIRLFLAKNRFQWIKANLIDLASVALPVLRPLRLIRLVTLLSVLQRTTGEKLRDRIISYTLFSTILLVFVSSLAILEAERPAAGANITSFSDALWWSVVTITTVGYGDYTPVTQTGRVITLGLMLGGMALIGIITATLASWITERASSEVQRVEDETYNRIAALEETINLLREELKNLQLAREEK